MPPQIATMSATKPYALNRSGPLPRPNHHPAERITKIAAPTDATAQKKFWPRSHMRQIKSPTLPTNSPATDIALWYRDLCSVPTLTAMLLLTGYRHVID